MDKNILEKLEIDITKFLGTKEEPSAPLTLPKFKAKLAKSPEATTNKIALLQVNIGEKGTNSEQLTAALELISEKFTSVTIFIDIQLTLLVYSIIMPYLNKEQLQDILDRKKLDWITTNMPVISSITIPWSIITDKEASIAEAKNNNILTLKEILKRNKGFHKQMQADAEALKEFLANNHDINITHYNLAKDKNDAAIESYLLSSIAAIKAMRSFNNHEYNYVTFNNMYSYDFLQKEELQDLPPYLTLELTKITDREVKELLNSTEINKNLPKMDFLSKISERKSYLENAAKNFPGTVYLQSLNHRILSCNEKQALTLGISNKSYLENKALTDIVNEEGAAAATGVAQEIITTDTTRILIESFIFLGKECTFLSIKTPLRNKKNKIIGIIGFSTQIETKEDIADFKYKKPEYITSTIAKSSATTTNKKNTYNQTSLEKTIAQMPGHVFWQDNNGKILGCNHYQAEFLGFVNPNEIIGKFPSDFLTAEYAIEAKEHLTEISTTGKPLIKEEVYKTADGFAVMTSHKTPIKDNDGKVIGIIVIAFDISDSRSHEIKLEREKEQLEIADTIRNQFIQDIEQDLRTPFINLCNMTESYANQETDNTKKKQLDEISSKAKELIAQYDALLEDNKNSEKEA